MRKIINKRSLLYIAIILNFNMLFSQNETREISIVFYRKVAHSPLRVPFFIQKEKFSFEYQGDTLHCFFKDKPDTVETRDGIIINSNVRQVFTKYRTHSVIVPIPLGNEIKEFVLYSDERIYYFKQNIKDKDVFDLYKMSSRSVE